LLDPSPPGAYPGNQSTIDTQLPVMTKLTQAQMRRLCVSENIVHAAAAWKAAMLHQQTPPLPHINVHKRELETYQTFMACVKACTDRAANFRKDGLGIWLTTKREREAIGKMFTIIFRMSDNWSHPDQVKQGIRGIDPSYQGSNVFFTRELAAAAASASVQDFSDEYQIIQIKDLEATLAA